MLRRSGLVALAAVAGPGLLAGLSDDDPAGITTYSILGADYGYQLLWVLVLSTAALILFHELGARMGVVTGEGLAGLIRYRYGVRIGFAALLALLIANIGTAAAAFAGVAAALELAGVPRWLSAPTAGVAIAVLVLRGTFKRIEHVLIAACSVFVAYVVRRCARSPGLGRRGTWTRRADAPGDERGPARGNRRRRDDARAVGSRVHPVVCRRQAAPSARSRLRARRRRRRRAVDRDHRVLRRRRLRCDAARPGTLDRGCGRRGRRARAGRRPLRFGALRLPGCSAQA